MEATRNASPERIGLCRSKKQGSEDTHLHNLEIESADCVNESANDSSAHHFHSTSALEILRETVRIMRFNSAAFMLVLALLICPVSAVLLSNVFVDERVVDTLTQRLLLIAKTSGLSIWPFIKELCHRFAEMIVSSAMCFPLFITLSLLSKAAVVYSVDYTYSRKEVDMSKLFVIVGKLWKKIVLTYLWVCLVIIGCVALSFIFLVAACSAVYAYWLLPDFVLYTVIIVGMVFSLVYANVIIICNIAIVIAVLEDVYGPQALHRSGTLIKGQTQVGLMIFLGSTIGTAFIEGLFEHRVKTLSYGDGSSRIWEGPLLVIMYSFVVLIDSMMNAVFYFSCKFYSMGASEDESQPILESATVSAESNQ